MRNYKECTDAEFAEAMGKLYQIKNGNIKSEVLPTAQLYIMYTKMKFDNQHLSGVNGTYAIGLRIATQKVKDALAAELIHRNVHLD